MNLEKLSPEQRQRYSDLASRAEQGLLYSCQECEEFEMLNDKAQGIEFRTGQPDDDERLFARWMRNIVEPLPEPHLGPPACHVLPPFENPNQP